MNLKTIMNSIILIICLFSITKYSYSQMIHKLCKPKFHYWRPFYGEYPSDKFIASTDAQDQQNYIAKIIVTDDTRSWTVPSQLNFDYVFYKWENHAITVTSFIEVLCTKQKHRNIFRWKKVAEDDDMVRIKEKCCLVEGGLVKWKDRTVTFYIGRVYVNSTFFIGAANTDEDWNSKKGVHIIRNFESVHFKKDFEMLVYDCVDDNTHEE